MLADRWKRKKILRGGVIGTLMSNYGLQKYFKERKIKFIRANVGDRYVKEKMQKNMFNLGGEQSEENNIIKLETQKDEPEIFDEKDETTEDQPLVLTNEIKENKKKDNIKSDQTLSPAVRKMVSEKKIDLETIKGSGKDCTSNY